MIVYFYWFLVFATAMGLLVGLGTRFALWKFGFVAATSVALAGTVAYYAYFEQVFVKRYGGTMSLEEEKGMYHIGMTWKDDNLWIESWDEASDECVFREYSRSGLLQGSVVIAKCNPLAARGMPPPGNAMPPPPPNQPDRAQGGPDKW